MTLKKFALVACMAGVAALSACSTSNPDVISRHDAQRMSQVQDATLLSVRAVTVDGSQSGVGAVAGGVVGAVAGSNVGGRTEGQIAGVLVGLAGAAVGNAIERNVTKEEAVEMLVQLRNGERRAIVQAKGGETLLPGDAVILVTSGGKTRVMRAPAVTPSDKN
ncbi:glycine zipper 2TM domain-containing protein [Paucibacter sp. AS339]|uniref:glycine zipper 2TM domain-containing protein n=1 Tax=Paucibacter hankyongi TaxID=3133434 RepID=UPI0030B174CE